MVELLVRWVNMEVAPIDEDEAYIKKLVKGEDSVRNPKFSYDYSPLTFNMKDVLRFNEASDKMCTTIRFADNESCVVKIEYKAFQQLYMECTGTTIHLVDIEVDEDDLDV